MKTNLQKLFESRLFTMILSLVIAVVAWLIVVTTISTETDGVIRDVPVNYDYNSSAYTTLGLDIVSQPGDTVDIRVYGQRRTINNMEKEDILVYPNYSLINGPGEYDLPLLVRPVDGSWDSQQVSILNEKDLPTVHVVFDTVVTKTFAVTADTSNVQIAEGYIFDRALCTPTEVTLRGPAGEIDKVDKVMAPLYLEGEWDRSVNQTATLVAVDENGEELDLKYVTFSSEVAEVTLSVLQRKELPLKVEFTNVPSGYDVSQLEERMSLSVDSMWVAGDSRRLESLSELTVGYFDVTTFALGRDYTIPIQMPDGIRAQENVNSITLSFDNAGLSEKTVTVSDIRTANVPDNYTIRVNTRRISNVTLIGPEEDLAGLTSASVIAQVNAEDFQVANGEVTVPVRIQVPGAPNVLAVGSYTADCKISTKN